MFQRIVPDSHTKGRWIAYTASSICVLIDQELRSLSDLLGWRSLSSRSQDVLRHEVHAFQETLFCRAGASLSPSLEGLFPQGSPYFIARSVALASVCCVSLAPMASALPTGYQSVSGDVQFAQTGDTLNVTTGAQKAIATYQSFNVAGHETVNFNLPNSRSAILNRVTGGDASQIMGRVNSNGQVYMVNTAGIVFGQGAQVNVGGLHASTLNITDADFMAETQHFKQEGAGAAITNQGVISGGDVTLIGSVIDNQGTIVAPGGHVNLAVGQSVTMVVDDSLAVKVTVDEGLKSTVQGYTTAIQNSGSISATEGVIALQAKLQGGLYDKAINNDGVIEALGLGDVVLTAHSTSQDAVVRNAGQIDVSGHLSTANGGDLTLDSDYLIQRGELKAEGAENGIGGHIYLTSTQGTLLTSGSLTSAKGAGGNSTAGDVVIWSDKNTYFRQGAVIDVSGGTLSGDAGFVEVSGKENVYFQGQARGYAANGQAGRILIDPIDIIISNAGGDTVDGGDAVAAIDETFAEGNATETYNPQAGGSFAGFGDIWLQATNDITINSAFDTNTATGNAGVSLRLEANNNIDINAALTTNNAAITLIADADSSGAGRVYVTSFGSIQSNGGNITLSAYNVLLSGGVFSNTGELIINSNSTISGGTIQSNNQTSLNSNGTISFTNLSGTGHISANSNGNDITLYAANNFLINTINAGSADVSIYATNGTLNDTDDIGDNLTGGTIYINTSSTIGNLNGVQGLNINSNLIMIIGTNGNNITITENGDLNIWSINTGGAGNISLTASSAINDFNDGSAHITTTGTLSLTSAGAIGASGGSNGLEVNVGNITITSTGGNDISLYEYGATSINSIATGGAGNISLISTSTINDIDDTGNNITTTGTLTLTSAGTIGNSGGAQGLNLSVGDISVISTGGNNITLREAAAMTIGSIATGGAGSISLTSTSTINDTDDLGDNITTTGTLSLTSTGAIGGTSSLNINTGQVTVTGTGGNNIDLTHSATLVAHSIATGGAGTITLTATTIRDSDVVDDSIANIITSGNMILTANQIGDGGSSGVVEIDTGVGVNGLKVTSSGNVGLEEVSGTVILDDCSGMYLFSAPGIVIPSGKTYNTSSNSSIWTDSLDISGSITNATWLNIYPKTSNTTVGLGGGAGALNLTNAELNNILDTFYLTIGNWSTGTITIDTIDLSSKSTNLELVTNYNTYDVVDGSAGDAVPNITLKSNRNLTMDVRNIGGAGAADLDIAMSGNGSVILNAWSNIYLEQTGTLNITSITATSVTLVASGGIEDFSDNSQSIFASTLSLTSNGAIGSVTSQGLNIDNCSNLTVVSTGGNNIKITSDSSAIRVNSIATGGAGDITLVSPSTINDMDDVGDNISTTGTLTLTSSGTIGNTSPLNINTGDVTITSTGGNNITLTDSGVLTAANIATGGAGTITLVGTSIYDTDITDDDTANITTTGSIILTASAGLIGTSINELDVDAGLGASALRATASAIGGSIYLQDTSGTVSLDNIVPHTWGNFSLKAEGIILPAGKSIAKHSETKLKADTMEILGTSGASWKIEILPLTPSTSIGLGGGMGTLNLTQTEMSNLYSSAFPYYFILGDPITSSGQIDIGTLNLSTPSIYNFYFYTTDSLTDGSVGDGVANIIFPTDTTFLVTGGNNSGSSQVGGPGLADINLQGSFYTEIKTNNSDIYLGYIGYYTKLKDIDAGSGNITLSSNNTLGSIGTSSASIQTTGTLTLSTNGEILFYTTYYSLDVGDITVLTSGGNNIRIDESAPMTIENIATGGAGVVTLTGTSISDTDITDDDTANITTTGSVILTATTGSVGSSTNELDINTGTAASGLKATATSGDIYIQETAGDVSLDTSQASSTTGVVRLKTAAAATLTLADTKTLSGTDITLLTDSLTIGTASASLSATASGTIRIAPITDNTGIGLGGGAGALSIADNEFSRMTAGTIVIGQDTTTGAIDIGSVNLSAELAHLTLKTTGALTDNNTGSDATANIILGANKNLTITGGGGTGSGTIGTSAANGDIDITTAGTGYLDIATNNADIYLTDTFFMFANLITSGSGNITLAGYDINDTDVLDDDNANIISTGRITLIADTLHGRVGQANNEFDVDAGLGALALKVSGGNELYLQEVSGTVNIDDIISGTEEVRLRAPGIVIPVGKKIQGSDNLMSVVTDSLDIQGSIVHLGSGPTDGIAIGPYTATNSMGVAGGSGTLDISSAELALITTPVLILGSTFYNNGEHTPSGDIDIGTLDLSAKNTQLSIVTTGNITDGSIGDGSANITLKANYALDLIAGSIGTSGIGDLDISLSGTGTVTSLTAITGDILIDSATSLAISGDISSEGELLITSSGGSITLDTVGTARSHSAQNITINAASGVNILNAGTVLLATGTGSLNTTYDDNAGTASIPVVTTGMTINASGTGGTITVNGELASVGTLRASGTSSDVSIAYTGSNLDLTNVTINASPGTNGVINLVGDTNAANDGTLDAQNASGTGTVTISTTGAFNISGTGLNILANSVSLTSGNTLTLSGDFNASSLDASTVGSLNLTDTASDLMLGTLSAGSTVDLTTNVGDITLTGTVSGTTVTLDSNGHILDGNVGATDIIATAGGTLDAGGWIGTWANPLEIQISGGTLGIRPLGLTGGISTVLNGSVAPVDTLTLLNSPLGQVWYNGVMLWPIIPPASGGGSTWFDTLTGGDWNAFRYPSEIYRDNVAEDYLEARLLHSRVLTEKNPQLMNRYIVPRLVEKGVLYQQEWARSPEELAPPSDDELRDWLLGDAIPLRTSLHEVHDETELEFGEAPLN